MIYIITPVFNRKNFTINYLEALEKQTNKNFKTIIVDDGSTDGTADMVKEKFPDVIVLKEKGDLWWAEATNIGVKYAIAQGADYIMTLNDDTVPYDDYIEKMYYWIKKEPYALLGALAINNYTKEIEYGGEILHWKNGKSTYILNHLEKKNQIGLHEVNIFPGRGLVIPTKVFEKIGFYDSKNFPQTVADNDFTFRAVNNGFKIYCNYDAKIKIYPDESATVSLRKRKNLKNYYNHLFSIRGGGNLKWFIKCTIKNCPKKYLVQHLAIGITKRIFGYLIKGN
jgi:GT2 family glycosyltransferase